MEPEAVDKGSSTTKFFIIAAVLLIAIGVALFLLSLGKQQVPDDNEKITYNGFNFEFYGGLWNTQWQNQGQVFNLRLHYNPRQVENVSIGGDDGWEAHQQTYISFDPDGSDFKYLALSAAEISLNLVNAFDITPVAACTANLTEACASRPIINCTNVPENFSVIYLKHASPTMIYLNGRCATIQGEGPDVVRAAEKAIYKWYGIVRD
ncbi:hypothetical protein HYU11_03545 [Candidatus Woesearchaeota archaeon]|nr:hypothetical protein [Candidatus Woesearchaeota archaeon]